MVNAPGASFNFFYFAEALPLFHDPILLLKLVSEDERKLDRILDLLGSYTDILSDYLNLTSPEVSLTNPVQYSQNPCNH